MEIKDFEICDSEYKDRYYSLTIQINVTNDMIFVTNNNKLPFGDKINVL